MTRPLTLDPKLLSTNKELMQKYSEWVSNPDTLFFVRMTAGIFTNRRFADSDPLAPQLVLCQGHEQNGAHNALEQLLNLDDPELGRGTPEDVKESWQGPIE